METPAVTMTYRWVPRGTHKIDPRSVVGRVDRVFWSEATDEHIEKGIATYRLNLVTGNLTLSCGNHSRFFPARAEWDAVFTWLTDASNAPIVS